MNLLRDRSFLWQLFTLAGSLAAVIVAALFAADQKTALWTLGASLLACALFTVFSYQRHRELIRLASEADEVLHDGRQIDFSDYQEGDVAILRNELQKMLDALRLNKEHLEKERNALADALADVSHQIRTPLTAMSLMIPLVEKAKTPQEKQATLHDLETMIDRVGWLVTTLLKLAKVDAGFVRVQQEEVNAAEVVKNAFAPLAISFDLHDVTYHVEADEQSSVVFEADAAWLGEAVENILKNCMEHTPAGGTVSVRIFEDALARRIQITDTGSGFAPEDLPRVFERFYRGQNEGQEQGRIPTGFGIGLALAQSLITAQGGSLKASNVKPSPEHPTGAVFDIAFPKLTV